MQYITFTPHRLEKDRVRRIRLDFSPQAVDLHVDRTFAAGGIITCQLVARDRGARPLREQAQQVALTLGELDGLVVASKLPPPHVKNEIAHPDFVAGSRWAAAALENVLQP